MDPFVALLKNTSVAAGPLLRVYLLGQVDFERTLALQRALVNEAVQEPDTAALILCEHPPLMSIGRQGSPADVQFSSEDLQALRWRMRWVNRGGGCWLHLPGQLAVYPILPLTQLGLGVQEYLVRLQNVLVDTLDDFGVRGQTRPGQAGVWVGSRPIAGVGIAVRDWVSYYGMTFNINPDLVPFRFIKSGTTVDGPMTSLERERHGPLRTQLVRERLLEHFTSRFAFDQTDLFFNHRALERRAASR